MAERFLKNAQSSIPASALWYGQIRGARLNEREAGSDTFMTLAAGKTPPRRQ